MKREYLIGAIFFVLFLAFMIGISFMGGKTLKAPQSPIVVNTPINDLLQPTPTLVPEPTPPEPTPTSDASSTIQSASVEEYWIAGYVSGEDHKILPKSIITVYCTQKSENSETPVIEKKAVTDEKGYYTIHLEGPIEGSVRSFPPEGYMSLYEEVTLTESQPTLAKHFTHPPAPFELRGKVIDALTKAPIAGAEVSTTCAGSEKKPHQMTEKTTSGEDGSFRIPRLTQGNYWLEASAEGYVRYIPYKVPDQPLLRIDVSKATQNKEYIIEMQPGLAATFHVVNSLGQAVEKAEIKITGEEDEFDSIDTGLTNRNGLATKTNLPKRTLYAEAWHTTEGRGFSAAFIPGMPKQPVRVEIALQPFASVSGKVLDTEGNTVPEKEVAAELLSVPGWKYPPSIRTEPNEQGNYSLDTLAPGSYRLCLTRSHYYPTNAIQSQTLELKAGEKRTGVDFIVKKEESMEIKGKVIDEETSEPLEGISVMAYPDNDSGGYFNDSIHARTDSQGEFLLTGLVKKSDQIKFILSGTSEYLQTNTNRPYGESYYTLTMKKGGQVNGVVLDNNDQPLAGAEVYPVKMYSHSPYHDTRNTQTTGDDGKFTFNKLELMDYRFHAKMEGFLEADSETISIREGTKVDTIVIRLEKGTGIYGSIVDPQGQPIANAVLSILSNVPDISKNSWGHPFSKPHYPQDAVSDNSGQFQIENFPSQGDTLAVQHPEFAPTLFAIDSSMIAQSPFTIRMTPGGSIVVTTYGSGGKKEANAALNTQNYPDNQFKYETRSDEEGEYRFDHLAPASYMVLNFGPQDDHTNEQYKTVQVDEGKATRCDFGGGEGAVIHGTVYKRGQISPNAKLLLGLRMPSPNQIGHSFKTVSDEQGAYSFSALDPGEYSLAVTSDSSTTTDPTQPLYPGNSEYSTTITVTENQSDYLVDIQIASLEIQGIVLDEETNEPIAGAQITTRYKTVRTSPPIIQTGDIRTKEDGSFTLLPTDSGSATLIASKEEYQSKEFDITVPPFNAGEIVEPIPVNVFMKKDDMAIFMRLFVEGKPAECSWIHIYAQSQEYNAMPLQSTPIETGYYRVYGMLEGEMEIQVSAYCYAKVMETLPQRITIRSGEKPQLMLNLYEEAEEFGISLVLPNDQILEGLALIELQGLPEPISYHVPIRSIPKIGFVNLVVVKIPPGVTQVRIHAPGYQPVEFNPADYPKEMREASPDHLIRLPLTP